MATQTAPHILVDGQNVGQVSALDRGLSYGDGVFRTIRIAAGQPRWWLDHLAKLAEDCGRLHLPMPRQDAWERDLAVLSPLPDFGVLRLTVTRGLGPRGYRLPQASRATRILTCWAEAAPVTPSSAFAPPVSLRICQLRLGYQPSLAGIKHLNRLENVLARSEWHDEAIDEGILLDQDGRVVSGVMSNIFIWREGRLLTPRLDLCGVAGVTRARLMDRALAAGIRVETGEFDLMAVLDAEEVMLTNSLMGLRRVGRLGDRHWPEALVSPRLSALLDD